MRRPQSTSFSLERVFQDVRDHLPDDIEVNVCVARFASRGIVRRVCEMVRATWHQGEVNHITGDVHFLSLFLRKRRTLLTIHDCVALERSRGWRRRALGFFWYWLPTRRCALVSVISDATRSQVLAHTGCDPAKLRVVHDCVSREFEPTPKAFHAACPRILHVGTKPNKNLDRHAAALEGLECRLVVIGSMSEAQQAAVARHGIRVENHVALSRAELLEQYRRCDLLLFASTYEGFGLPIVEAQAVGRPVVAGEVWSMPEVAGGAACLVDPFDAGSIRAGVRRVISDATYRDRLIELGFVNARRFRAQAIAEQYAMLYREIRGEAR